MHAESAAARGGFEGPVLAAGSPAGVALPDEVERGLARACGGMASLNFQTDRTPVIIDLRSPEAFAACRLKRSCNIPAAVLTLQVRDLPPRGWDVILVAACRDDAVRMADVIVAEGYRCPLVVVASEPLYGDPQMAKFVERGVSPVRVSWQPSPPLASHIEEIENHLRRKGVPEPWTALDVACGRGRDAIFLALRGWRVTCVDNQLEAALVRVEALAERFGVKELIELKHIDVEKVLKAEGGSDELVASLPPACLVNVARYLHRPLFDTIKAWVAPGGCIVFHTFMVGCEAFGRPKNSKYLLRDGELREVFSPGWEVCLDERMIILDGRPCSYFVARKEA